MMRDDAFWEKVDKSGDCWIWVGVRTAAGYGQMRRDGALVYAHRYVLTLMGTDPGTLNVDHICHVRACVNPAHLRLVTDKQNNENRLGANRNSRSGLRGVFYCDTFNKWFGSVTHNRKVYRKSFASAEEANRWAIEKRTQLFTHNDIDRISA